MDLYEWLLSYHDTLEKLASAPNRRKPTRMMKHILLLALVTCRLACASAAPTVEAQYNALLALDDELVMQSAVYDTPRLSLSFDGGIARTRLSTATTAEVELVFRAARIVAARTFSSPHLRIMRSALDELVQRDAARPQYVKQMTAMYVAARDIDAARSLNRRLPEAERVVVPTVIGEKPRRTAPAVLELERSPTGWVLTRQPIDLHKKMIVVVASPACSFSQKMFERAAQSHELSALLQASRIVQPQTTVLLLDEIHAWNTANPTYRFAYVDSAAQWLPIDAWDLPSFYFLDGGKVVAKLAGWQPGVTETELLKRFREWSPDAAQ